MNCKITLQAARSDGTCEPLQLISLPYREQLSHAHAFVSISF
jgi:hypothetical protein